MNPLNSKAEVMQTVQKIKENLDRSGLNGEFPAMNRSTYNLVMGVEMSCLMSEENLLKEFLISIPMMVTEGVEVPGVCEYDFKVTYENGEFILEEY